MKTIKVAELTGAALDWAVAKCEGPDTAEISDGGSYMVVPGAVYWNEEGEGFPVEYSPSTDWAQGGPIIEREKLDRISTNVSGGFTVSRKIVELLGDDDDSFDIRWVHGVGSTTLTAAMRCYVAGKMGNAVQIPEELL